MPFLSPSLSTLCPHSSPFSFFVPSTFQAGLDYSTCHLISPPTRRTDGLGLRLGISTTNPNKFTMSLLHDSTIVPSKCQAKKNRFEKEIVSLREYPVKHHSMQKSTTTPSVSSIIRNSLSWAGDALYAYRDGLSRDERRKKMDIEDRKQILYLRMRNVSATIFCYCFTAMNL